MYVADHEEKAWSWKLLSVGCQYVKSRMRDLTKVFQSEAIEDVSLTYELDHRIACCVSPTPYLSTNALTLELVEAIDTDKVGNHDHYEVTMPPLQYPQITFAPHSATLEHLARFMFHVCNQGMAKHVQCA